LHKAAGIRGLDVCTEISKKRKVIVIEDVKGSTVQIDFGSSVSDFDDFLPEAQKVVDSVKWSGS